MSEEKQKSKKCLYCGNYESYYIKGLRRFESIKKVYCSNFFILSNRKDRLKFIFNLSFYYYK